MNKKPRFFCDNCGTEVGRNVDACPRCGRFFASVRCPKCGFSADEGSFKGGCPSCGYSAPTANPVQPSGKKIPAGKRIPAGKLPPWVYILSTCAFILTLAILIFILGK